MPGTYPKIIAVDFDGTLCENEYPIIGKPRQEIINRLLEEQANGAKIILWTCRSGSLRHAAVLWCLNHGIHFDAINENLPENIKNFGSDSRKVYAHEYWDDRAVEIPPAKKGANNGKV